MANTMVARRAQLVALIELARSNALDLPPALATLQSDPSKLAALKIGQVNEAECALIKLILPANTYFKVVNINGEAKRSLAILTVVALFSIIMAVTSAMFSFMHSTSYDETDDIKLYIWLSIFGIALGTLGACCQILQRYKLIADPKKAGPLTELNLVWAWLLWGVIAGWIVTFMFSALTFRGFLQFNSGGDLDGGSIAGMLSPLLPIAAGYSSTLLGTLLDKVRTSET